MELKSELALGIQVLTQNIESGKILSGVTGLTTRELNNYFDLFVQ